MLEVFEELGEEAPVAGTQGGRGRMGGDEVKVVEV